MAFLCHSRLFSFACYTSASRPAADVLLEMSYRWPQTAVQPFPMSKNHSSVERMGGLNEWGVMARQCGMHPLVNVHNLHLSLCQQGHSLYAQII